MAKLWDDTRSYNAIGRHSRNSSSGSDNFFTKKAKSIENALGTTGAVVAAGVHNMETDAHTKKMQNDQKNERDALFQKYGFQSRDDYYKQLEDSWDADGNATAETERLLNIPGLDEEEKALNNKHMGQLNEHAAELRDWAENNYVSKKIGQDRGKFLGSAINTLSTAADVMLPGAGVAFNAVQGGVEGIADELEDSGFKDFDWKRAGQNAAIGAITGGVTGAVNQGISNSLAKNGGNLFKGGNKLTRGINTLGSSTPAGRIGSTIATGAGRGAISGAVGGATGAGLSSAMNGASLSQGIANTLQGAKQGALQGAGTGATMAGVNMALNATPGVGKVMRDLNQASEDWKNSGSNFDERLSNTLENNDTWGTRFVKNRIADAEAVANGFRNVGEGVGVLADRINDSPLRNIGGTTQDISSSDNTLIGEADASALNKSPETELYRTIYGEAEAPRMANTQWDNVARDAGYNDYDELVQKFVQANPGTEPTASNVLDWLDTPQTSQTTNSAQTQVFEAVSGGKTSKAGKLRNAAGLKLAAQYGTIDKPTAKATNPPKTLTELADLGFTDPADVERMAGAMTGSNGEMSALVKNIVRNSEPVDTYAGETSGQTLDDYINLSIQKHGLDGINEGKAVKSQINALMKSLPSHAEGSVDFKDAPETVFKVTQQLDAEAANYRGKSGMNYGTTTPDKLRAAQVISDVSDLLKNRIYSTSDVKQALTPEVANNLKAYAPENKAWADYVDNTVMNMENVKDLRSAQANWVNANKIIDNGYVNSMTYGGRASGGSTIPLSKRGLVSAVLDKTINSNPGLRAQAKILNKAADFVENSPNAKTNAELVATVEPRQTGTSTPDTTASASIPSNTTATTSEAIVPTPTPQATTTPAASNGAGLSTQLYNSIGRTEGEIQGENAARGYLQEAARTSSPVTINNNPSTALYNSINGTTGTNSNSGTTTMASNQNPATMTSSDYYTNIIYKAMMAAAQDNNVDAFIPLYQMLQDALTNQQKSETSQTKLTDKQRQANAAMRALEDMENAENNFGFDVSDIPVLGGIANMRGNDYKSKAEALALQVGYMLSGATVNKEEAKKIGESYVPQPRESEAERRRKLNQLRGIISDYQQTYEA